MYMTKILLILNCSKVDWKNIIKTIKNVDGYCRVYAVGNYYHH